MPRFENEVQKRREILNSRQINQNAEAQQNVQAQQNAQLNQNAQANFGDAANVFENRDMMARPTGEILDIINGEGQVNNEAIRQRLNEAERLGNVAEGQINAHQAAMHQAGVLDVDANITMKKAGIVSKYHPVRRGEKADGNRIGTYIKNAPKGYKKKLDGVKGVSPVAQIFNMSMTVSQIMNVQAISGSEHMNEILTEVGQFQEQIKDIQRLFSNKKYYNEDGYFDYTKVYENEEFSFVAVDAIADRVLSIRRKLGTYIERNSGLFHANSKKGAARLKAAKDLKNLIDYELIGNLSNVIEILIGNKPASLSANEGWVELDKNEFESDVVAQEQEAPQRMLEVEREGDDWVEVEKEDYAKKQVNKIYTNPMFTQQQLTTLTEDDKNSLAQLISKEITVEERESFADEQMQKAINAELKIGSRNSAIAAQIERLGLRITGSGDFNRMFRELIRGSADKTTMAVEEQLLTALETGDFNTIKAFAHQVRDELSRLPVDLESYKRMDYETLARIGYMGMMFDVLRKSRVLFPENESDPTLDKIAGIKSEIASGIRRIISTQVINTGRSYERFYFDPTRYLESPEQRQEYKEEAIGAGVSECLGSGIAALRNLQAQLQENAQQWDNYGKYFEDQEYTSNVDARLRLVGDVNVEELSGRLANTMEQNRKKKLAFFNRKLEAFAVKVGQSDRFYALCNLCKEADGADKNLSPIEKEKFFDRLVIELSKYIDSTGNSENKLDAVILRQSLLRYMKEENILPVRYSLNVSAQKGNIHKNQAPKLDKYEDSVVEQLLINDTVVGQSILEKVPDFKESYLRLVTLARYEKSRAFKEIYENKFYLMDSFDEYFAAKGKDFANLSMREKYRKQREMRIFDLNVLFGDCNVFLGACREENKRAIVADYQEKVNELLEKLNEEQFAEAERE